MKELGLEIEISRSRVGEQGLDLELGGFKVR